MSVRICNACCGYELVGCMYSCITVVHAVHSIYITIVIEYIYNMNNMIFLNYRI